MAQNQNGFKTTAYYLSGAIVLVALSGSAFYFSASKSQTPAVAPSNRIAPVSAVTALGRLEPKGAVIKLSVANAKDSRVDRLLVKAGDYVKAGQVIAILQGLNKKQAAIAEAQQNVKVEQTKLEQTLAGTSKPGAIVAQQAAVARIQAQLRTQTIQNQAGIDQARAEFQNAQTDYQRYQKLYQAGAVSASDLDTRRKNFATAQAQLNENQAQLENTTSTLREQLQQERATLNSLVQVRPVDVRIPQAQIEYALAQLTTARINLEDFYVRAPLAGRILKINTNVGEQVDVDEGIVDLGQTDQMYAIAEVYETDITKVHPGQRVTVMSENGGFEGKLQGVVEQISLQIKKQDVLDTDPATDKDARVVEVKIRLKPEDSRKVAGLTNLQVRTRIELN
jgi:HlyD family secretion protein